MQMAEIEFSVSDEIEILLSDSRISEIISDSRKNYWQYST